MKYSLRRGGSGVVFFGEKVEIGEIAPLDILKKAVPLRANAHTMRAVALALLTAGMYLLVGCGGQQQEQKQEEQKQEQVQQQPEEQAPAAQPEGQPAADTAAKAQ